MVSRTRKPVARRLAKSRAAKPVAPVPLLAAPIAVAPVSSGLPVKRPVAARRRAPAPGRASTAVGVGKPIKPIKATKAEKPKKAKLVRDNFAIPKPEYLVLEQLKQRAAQLGAPIKKSELLRAGIKALAAMDSTQLLTVLAAVPPIKPGRAAKS